MTKRTKAATTELRDRIQSEGALVAYEALLAVCRDKSATPQARATAGSSIFRAAGFFEKIETGEGKELHELTAEELQERIDSLQRAREGRGAYGVAEEDEGAAGVFD